MGVPAQLLANTTIASDPRDMNSIERRDVLRDIVRDGFDITNYERSQLAEMFGVSHSTISVDIYVVKGELAGAPELDEFASGKFSRADLLNLDPTSRRRVLIYLQSRYSDLTIADLSNLLGVSHETIVGDRRILRLEAKERLESDTTLSGDLFEPLETMRDDALADVECVEPNDPQRAAHRRTALAAHKELFQLMFRIGYLQEVPKRSEITGADGGPIASASLNEHRFVSGQGMSEALDQLASRATKIGPGGAPTLGEGTANDPGVYLRSGLPEPGENGSG